jgi:hypothetical protein
MFYYVESIYYIFFILDQECVHYRMTINGFALACAIDESPPYFTYYDHTMLIIQSKDHAKSKIDDFQYIEPFIEALISHESIHVVIKDLEGANTSDSLDDVEIIVERHRAKFQVTLNNILFSKDMSGIVTP